MDFRKHSLLLEMIEQFHQNAELPTSTHIQKAASVLDSTDLLTMPFSFILYKHGPYSVDIEFELDQMKSYLAIYADSSPMFSQVLRVGKNGPLVKDKAPLKSFEITPISNVCRFLAGKPLAQVELLATAAWVRAQEHLLSATQVASRLRNLKPYVSDQDALRRSIEITELATNELRERAAG